MHFTIASDALSAALKSSVATAKSTLPILSQVRVRATVDNRVSFLTTDLEAAVEVFCDADVKAAGAQCMQVTMLRPVLDRDDDVTVNGDVLKRGRSRYKVPGNPAEDFPATEQGERWETVSVDPVALAYAVRTVAYPVDGGNPNANYRAVMVVPGLAWGTHSHRGARVAVAYDGPTLAIPPHQVDRLCEALAVDGAELWVANRREDRAGLLRVSSRDHVLTLRLLDVEAFDFLRATPLPEESRPHIRFKTAHVRNLVRRFLPFTEVAGGHGKFLVAELVSERGEIELADRSGDNRENLTAAAVHVSGNFRGSFSPKLLLDALNAVSSDEVLVFNGDGAKRLNFCVLPVHSDADSRPEELHIFAGAAL